MTRIDDRRRLDIRSPHDGSIQFGMLSLPRDSRSRPLALVIAPHPFGWSVEEDYHGGCAGLKAASHRGWLGIPSEMGIAVLQPEGHHRVVDRCSMGYEGVVRDLPKWIEAVDDVVQVDESRIYACGLSMGGQESLLLAGSYPQIIAAAFAFNPVVDAAAWQRDLARTTVSDLRAEGSDALIVTEVGGTPDEIPDAYTHRSALNVTDGLQRVPLAIWWSWLDVVVPRQVECHGKRLYDELKRLDPTAPVTEYDHTVLHALSDPPTDDERWAIHETADYALATRWLMLHSQHA